MNKSVENCQTCAWRNKARHWWHCLKGATAIEYGLIAGAIAVAISITVFLIGTDIRETFQSISDMLK